MSSKTQKRKGPWWVRFGVKALAVALALLLYWLLSFVVDDIGRIRGPDYGDIEKEYVEQVLLDREAALQQEVAETKRAIDRHNKRMRALGESTRELQTRLNAAGFDAGGGVRKRAMTVVTRVSMA